MSENEELNQNRRRPKGTEKRNKDGWMEDKEMLKGEVYVGKLERRVCRKGGEKECRKD